MTGGGATSGANATSGTGRTAGTTMDAGRTTDVGGTPPSHRLERGVGRSLFSPWRYLATFLVVAFVVTCSTILLLNGWSIPEEQIRETAPLVFLNIFLLSLLVTVGSGLYQKLTMERPVKRILAQTHAVASGDFSSRIETGADPFHRTELDAIAGDLNAMAEELSSVETLRTDFVANVSHEMKSPLSSIRSNAVLLEDSALPDRERADCIQSIITATDRMSDLITSMLRLTKLENQQIFPETCWFDLAEQLRTILIGFEDAWEAKGLSIEADIPDEMRIKGDSDLLSSAWSNLLSNAVKFTDEGGTIGVSLSEQDGWAIVSVEDDGMGMDAATGAHIFEKFYQADSSHATAGNGLGLALVKRIIDIIGGQISVHSELGIGSTFIVRIKRDPDATS